MRPAGWVLIGSILVLATVAAAQAGQLADGKAEPALSAAMTTTTVRALPVHRPRMLGSGGDELSVVVPIMPAAGPAAAGPAVAPEQTVVVRTIQQHLQRRGFAPGPADGHLGARTRAAIRAFQRACGLATDGAVSDILIARLIGADACPGAGSR